MSNSARGANGIKIALEEVQEGKPVIITSGNLSGCTTIVARKEGYIYKVHTGTTKSLAGFTSTTGVKKAVEVLELLTKEPIPRVEGIMSNDFLVDYLSENFEDSLITYSSSEKNQIVKSLLFVIMFLFSLTSLIIYLNMALVHRRLYW